MNFGTFVSTNIVRDKTSTNWHNWHKMLADNPVECASGEALTALRLDAGLQKYKFECSKIGGLGSCFDYYSAQVTWNAAKHAKLEIFLCHVPNLCHLRLRCPASDKRYITGQSQYKCSKRTVGKTPFLADFISSSQKAGISEYLKNSQDIFVMKVYAFPG